MSESLKHRVIASARIEMQLHRILQVDHADGTFSVCLMLVCKSKLKCLLKVIQNC